MERGVWTAKKKISEFRISEDFLQGKSGLCHEADQVLHGRDSCRPDC